MLTNRRNATSERKASTVFIPANHSLQAYGQVLDTAASDRNRTGTATWRGALDRCNKAIAPARYVGDIARTVLAITERPAESSNMDPKTGFLDNDV